MNIENSPPPTFSDLLQKTLHCSRYAKRVLEIDPALLDWLQNNHTTPFDRAEMQALLQMLDPCDETELARVVRQLRKLVMVRLILRDLNGLADLNEVMHTITALAEVCVQRAQACLMLAMQQQYGSPLGETSGTHQELLVIGMGKLGGEELNVSSDIDLIFVYPEDGQSSGPSSRAGSAAGYPIAAPSSSRSLSNHEFFTRLGRRLINLINEPTADGYVFRVDMRLRPYGESGPLVTSYAALEEYLVSQGREWERYAWIKARVVSPANCQQNADLAQLVQPFVYRKYLDFGAIDSMRRLHAQIRQEVQRRDLFNNIKLGPGGIREIEFTAQVFQLIRGGQDAKLRVLPTRRVLQVLAANGQLGAQIVADLDAAYVFLRNLEHRLQYLDDRQTQELPENPEDRQIIADAMGYADYAALLEDLDRHRALVSRQFDQIFGAHVEGQNDAQLWREGISEDELNTQLKTLGYQDPANSAQRLMQLRAGNRYLQLPELSRQRLDKLIPQFITLSAQHGDPRCNAVQIAGPAGCRQPPRRLSRLPGRISAGAAAPHRVGRRQQLGKRLFDAAPGPVRRTAGCARDVPAAAVATHRPHPARAS